MNRTSGYDLVSRINHWVIAIAVIGMIAVGLYLEFGGLSREESGPLRDIHKAAGVLLLVLILWRVGWRLLRGFPAPASSMPAWQLQASKAAHWILLVGIVLMPVSGIVSSLFNARPIDVFGLFTVAAAAEVPWLASSASWLHTLLGRALALLVVIHVAAALKHHFTDRDPTLTRMIRGS